MPIARLVAANAGDDVLKETLLYFSCEMRIGNLGSHHDHRVSLSTGKNFLSENWIRYSTDCEELGVVQGFFHCRESITEKRIVKIHWRVVQICPKRESSRRHAEVIHFAS